MWQPDKRSYLILYKNDYELIRRDNLTQLYRSIAVSSKTYQAKYGKEICNRYGFTITKFSIANISISIMKRASASLDSIPAWIIVPVRCIIKTILRNPINNASSTDYLWGFYQSILDVKLHLQKRRIFRLYYIAVLCYDWMLFLSRFIDFLCRRAACNPVLVLWKCENIFAYLSCYILLRLK